MAAASAANGSDIESSKMTDEDDIRVCLSRYLEKHLGIPSLEACVYNSSTTSVSCTQLTEISVASPSNTVVVYGSRASNAVGLASKRLRAVRCYMMPCTNSHSQECA